MENANACVIDKQGSIESSSSATEKFPSTSLTVCAMKSAVIKFVLNYFFVVLFLDYFCASKLDKIPTQIHVR